MRTYVFYEILSGKSQWLADNFIRNMPYSYWTRDGHGHIYRTGSCVTIQRQLPIRSTYRTYSIVHAASNNATSRRHDTKHNNKKIKQARQIRWHAYATTMLWFALPTLCLLHKIYTVNCCHNSKLFYAVLS